MIEGKLNPGLQRDIRALAQAVLQHLLYPIVLLFVSRRQRGQIVSRVLYQWGDNEVKGAITTAFLKASVFSHVFHRVFKGGLPVITLSSTSDAEGSTTAGVTSLSATTPSKFQRSLSISLTHNFFAQNQRGGMWNVAAVPSPISGGGGGGKGGLPARGSGAGTNTTANNLNNNIPGSGNADEEQLRMESQVENMFTFHIGENEHQGILEVAACGEVLYWEKEPARSVLILLSGSLVEEGALLRRREGGLSSPRSLSRHPLSSNPASKASPNSNTVEGVVKQNSSSIVPLSPRTTSQRNEERRESASATTKVNITTGISPLEEDKGPSSENEGKEGRKKPPFTPLDPDNLLKYKKEKKAGGGPFGEVGEEEMGGGEGNDWDPSSTSDGSVIHGPKVRVYKAPAVWGEMPCLGGHPYGASLIVESPLAIYTRISYITYSKIVASTGKLELQRALLYESLQLREVLLPCYAPMSIPRLRLCPLLTYLSEDVLDELYAALIPRVFPAGAQINKFPTPLYIYLIRKGVVRREPDAKGYRDASEARCDRPIHQALLVEGHSFGELTCTFREVIQDAYYAVNTVDVYLLPYTVLESIMDRLPIVKKEVEKQAKLLHEVRGAPYASLKFTPTALDPRQFLEGLVPSDAYCMTLYKKVMTEQRLVPDSGSRKVLIADGGGGGGGGDSLQGNGRVTASLLEAIQQIPVISLVAPSTVVTQCLPLWRCVHYHDGEIIVKRGEECNRLLFFYFGVAGVVMDEMGYKQEGASGRSVIPIPKGKVLGFTCVRRHRWMHSVVALENDVEVWEIKRSTLVLLLHQCNAAEAVNLAVQQVLQPLYFPLPLNSQLFPSITSRTTSLILEASTKLSTTGSNSLFASGEEEEEDSWSREDGKAGRRGAMRRHMALDFQPLLHPEFHSFWGSHPVPALHPVSLVSHTCVYPVWKEGDFPLGESTTAQVPNSRSRRISHQVASSMVMQLTLPGGTAPPPVAEDGERAAPNGGGGGVLPGSVPPAVGWTGGTPSPQGEGPFTSSSVQLSPRAARKGGRKSENRPPPSPFAVHP